MKKLLAPILACFLILSAAGCSKTVSTESSSAQPDTVSVSEASDSVDSSENSDEQGTYTFTDSCGREVELPKNVERIAPSGPLAQIVLYTLCPDKMVGWATEFTDAQQKYIDSKYASLPIFGNFYGDTLNLESVMYAKPQAIFDIGEPKKSVKEDMDGIQEKTGVPTVFVEMNMKSMATAYKTLGEITGETEQAQKITDYIDKTLSDTKAKLESIPEDQRLSVFYGQDEGLTAVVKGTVHSDVIDYAGGINVADVEKSIRGGANEVSMEQLLLWNPDVILFAPGSIYDSVSGKGEWGEVSAIKSSHFYEIPAEPYNWMGRPPSVNRVLGIKWLSNLLYLEVFNYDMVKEIREFYKTFYHCEITEEQVKNLLKKSTYK